MIDGHELVRAKIETLKLWITTFWHITEGKNPISMPHFHVVVRTPAEIIIGQSLEDGDVAFLCRNRGGHVLSYPDFYLLEAIMRGQPSFKFFFPFFFCISLIFFF
jgi:hypothetical protein